MLITRSRQLPDGEELVWAETVDTPEDLLDPRESACLRRGQALADESEEHEE
jgi:hypothetical protein